MMRQRAIATILVLMLLCAVHFVGCSDSDGSGNPVNSAYLFAPRVTNFQFRTYGGVNTGTWGVPLQNSMTSVFNYPNPFNPSTTIEFGVATGTHVKVWIVKALGPTEDERVLAGYAAAGLIKPGGAPLEILLDDYVEAGFHAVSWEAYGYPDGFYCVYLSADGYATCQHFMLLWWGHGGDVFDYLYHNMPGSWS